MPSNLTLGALFACLVLALGTASAQDNGSRAAPPAGVTMTLPNAAPAPTASPAGDVFRVGYLTSADPGDQRRRLTPFEQHMEGTLSRPVELIPFREARGLMSAIQRGQVEYGIGPGSVFASLNVQCGCVEPIATQPSRSGVRGLFAGLVVRQDDALNRSQAFDELSPSRIGIIGEGSVVAHRVGLSELVQSGVSVPVGSEADYLFFENLDEGVNQLLGNQADALLIWTRQSSGEIFDSEPPAHTLTPEEKQQLRIIWRSRPVFEQTHFVSTELGSDFRERLTQMIINVAFQNGDAFDAIDQGSGRPFEEVSLSDYAPLVDALRTWSGR